MSAIFLSTYLEVTVSNDDQQNNQAPMPPVITQAMVSFILGLVGVIAPIWVLSSKFTSLELQITAQQAQIAELRNDVKNVQLELMRKKP